MSGVAVIERQPIQLMLALEEAGALTPVSLDLSKTDMTYDTWESLGRFLGALDRSIRWYLGDWLLFGEKIFGEESSQAVEATTAERYDVAEQVTGLAHQTLLNIASVCSRVPRSRRRPNLSFSIHAEVAALEPEEQKTWLKRAEDEGLTVGQLRALIRGDDIEPAADGDGPLPVERMSRSEQIEEAAARVWHQAQKRGDGMHLVPSEAVAALGTALGEGE